MSLFRSLSLIFAVLALAALSLRAGDGQERHGKKRWYYPPTAEVDQVDVYHGTAVADPYRWLEDPNSEQTKAWVKQQNELTFDYLHSLPGRDRLRGRLRKLWNFERFGVPLERNGRLFYTRNDGLQNQSPLYVQEGLSGKPRLLLDPNTLSKDGTVSLGGTWPSDDGTLLAYSIRRSGSDWIEIKVRNVATGKDTGDHIRWVKFSGANWSKDGKGFYYSRYREPKADKVKQGANFFQKLYYHRIGTPQSEDALVYERPEHKKWGFDGAVTDDGNYLAIHIWRGAGGKNGFAYRDLKGGGDIQVLTEAFDASYYLLGNEGPRFWFQTNLDAPNGRVIEIDLRQPGKANWRTVIPEGKEALEDVLVVGDRFVVHSLHNAHSVLRLYKLDGSPDGEIELPTLGSAWRPRGLRKHRRLYFSFSGMTYPSSILLYDFDKRGTEVLRSPKVDFDPALFETKQVWYASKDGTKVPMFLLHKKGLKLDGTNPTILYGYGGFNISQTPWFRLSALVWAEMGGVFAMPNLRGGGEFGEKWHQAGMKHNKQNVFDDFIAAAEWLVAQKYTRPSRLAIWGGSNGGLLVGACMAQRPELYGAALPEVGVMDMLRYHKFTIGWAWVGEYGSSENPEEFKTLLAYSPLHSIRLGRVYPPTLCGTADTDDRVVPAHSYKWIATLQKATQGARQPHLIRIETKAGHGAGTPTSKRIEALTDKLVFLVENLDFELPASFR